MTDAHKEKILKKLQKLLDLMGNKKYKVNNCFVSSQRCNKECMRYTYENIQRGEYPSEDIYNYIETELSACNEIWKQIKKKSK